MGANPNYVFLRDHVPNQRWTNLQGGTRSGKTYATIYFIIDLCKRHEGIEIDIVRDTFTALKQTVWKDFKEILVEYDLYNAANHNKTDHIYNLFGNTINYYGADDPAKIHGRSRDVLWLNEGNQFKEETIDQLTVRTRHRIICDFNPALEVGHWLDPILRDYPPLITTYLDNPFLTDVQIADIESKRGNKYFWKVYGTGERSAPVGVIFENWTYGDFPENIPVMFGQDYGFSNDPTTLVKIAVDEKKKELYINEELNRIGMTTSDIAAVNKRVAGQSMIVGDSAEPRLIEELKRMGCRIKAAKKGAGSITAGISKMQDYKIVITKSSENIATELNNYKWADKKSGVPVDKYNHQIDAVRYAFGVLTGNAGNYAYASG